MSTYYVLEKNTFESMTLRLPTEDIDQSGWYNLGPEPFKYDTYEEAKKVKESLDIIFKKRPSSVTFIIVEETDA